MLYATVKFLHLRAQESAGEKLMRGQMNLFLMALKCLAAVFLLVAGLHFALGVGAEVLLGAKLSAEAVAEPTLNSQDRFYGVAFSLNAVILYFSSQNLKRYEPLLKAVCVVCFVGGLSRILSWVLHGSPAPMVVFLGATELVGPPLLLYWLGRVKNEA
jgi:Domain of unknown function (DUF4345)